jgi:hypothetical protein
MHTTTWAIYRLIVNSLTEPELREALMQAYTLIEEQKAELARKDTLIAQSTVLTQILTAVQPTEYNLTP